MPSRSLTRCTAFSSIAKLRIPRKSNLRSPASSTACMSYWLSIFPCADQAGAVQNWRKRGGEITTYRRRGRRHGGRIPQGVSPNQGFPWFPLLFIHIIELRRLFERSVNEVMANRYQPIGMSLAMRSPIPHTDAPAYAPRADSTARKHGTEGADLRDFILAVLLFCIFYQPHRPDYPRNPYQYREPGGTLRV